MCYLVMDEYLHSWVIPSFSAPHPSIQPYPFGVAKVSFFLPSCCRVTVTVFIFRPSILNAATYDLPGQWWPGAQASSAHVRASNDQTGGPDFCCDWRSAASDGEEHVTCIRAVPAGNPPAPAAQASSEKIYVHAEFQCTLLWLTVSLRWIDEIDHCTAFGPCSTRGITPSSLFVCGEQKSRQRGETAAAGVCMCAGLLGLALEGNWVMYMWMIGGMWYLVMYRVAVLLGVSKTRK